MNGPLDQAALTRAIPAADRPSISCMAVVIAFNPTSGFVDLVGALGRQFDSVVIVDNGDGEATARMLGSLLGDRRFVHLRNEGNVGVAAALNRGLDHARSNGIRWMVTFDHDSLVDDGYCAALFDRHDPTVFEKIAVIGPLWRRQGGSIDFAEHLVKNQRRLVDVPNVITSGSCVNVPVASQIGAFDAALFIDSVDQDFCLRARRSGYRVVVDRTLRMEHRLGEERQVRWMGRRFAVTNHSPTRRYYMSRNKIVLWRRNFFHFPHWVLTDIKWHGADLLKVFGFERNRARKLVAVVVGNVHGLCGVRSQISPWLAKRLSP